MLYIDNSVRKEIASGADATFYSSQMLVQRDQMRTDPQVLSAIATAWAACAQGEHILSKDAYHAMSRRLYLVLAPAASQATIRPDDWRR